MILHHYNLHSLSDTFRICKDVMRDKVGLLGLDMSEPIKCAHILARARPDNLVGFGLLGLPRPAQISPVNDTSNYPVELANLFGMLIHLL